MILCSTRSWRLSLGIFLGAYSYGVAAILDVHFLQTPLGILAHLSVAPVGLAIGLAIGGWAADHLGRKPLLLVTPAGYFLSGPLIAGLSNRVIILIGCTLLLVAAGSESIAIMTYDQKRFHPLSENQHFMQ